MDTLEPLLLMSASTIEGSDAADWIAGDENDNTILAGAGNDEIYAPLGVNTIDGGSGVDQLVIYQGVRADFSVDVRDDGSVQVRGPGLNGETVVNTLYNVERILFNDQVFNIATPNESAEPDIFVVAPADATPLEVSEQFFETPAAAPFVPEVVATPGFGAPSVFVDFIPAAVEPPPVAVEPPTIADQFMDEVMRLTNNIRQQFGLSQLTVSVELENAAQLHADNLAFQDFFAHTGLDGREPWDRALDAGYDYRRIGENIAAGQLTPQEVVDAWFASASHRDNILNPNFKEIGIGYSFLANDTGVVNFNHYWTQLFGEQL